MQKAVKIQKRSNGSTLRHKIRGRDVQLSQKSADKRTTWNFKEMEWVIRASERETIS